MIPQAIRSIQSLVRVSRFAARRGRKVHGRVIHPGFEEIELLIGGKATFHMENKAYPVQAGSMLWHRAGDMTVNDADQDDPYRCVVFCFQVPVLRSRQPRRAPRLSQWENYQSALLFADHLERSFHRQDIDRDLLCQFAATTCYWHASATSHQSVDPNLPAVMTKTLDVIEQQFAENISVSDIADHSGVSVPHLHDLVRRHLSSTPHQLLFDRRMQHARWLLANTTQSITEIAIACGYMQSGSFCRAFGRQQKISPTAYRRAYATPRVSR